MRLSWGTIYSQLYHNYGNAETTLIGLFKTKFAFASDDPNMENYIQTCGRKLPSANRRTQALVQMI